MHRAIGLHVTAFHSLADLTPRQQDVVRSIYEDAFPSWQRVPFEVLVQSDHDPSRLQLVMVDGEQPLALAVLSKLSSVRWWFLEYFAVTHERRGKGLGGELWQAVVERLGQDSELGIVMEVEPPEEVSSGSEEAIERQRRIEFYRRRGALRLDVPVYRVPHLSGDGIGTLTLLAVPGRRGAVPTDGEVEEVVRALYVEGYALSPDHPLLVEALAAMHRPGRATDPAAGNRSDRLG